MKAPLKIILGISAVGTLLFGSLIGLRVVGLIRPFNVPNNSMAPAIPAGSNVIMEGFTLRGRNPERGDIVVFDPSDSVTKTPPGTLWIKRVAALPGEQVEIREGKLYINGAETALNNEAGPILFWDPAIDATAAPKLATTLTTTVPPSEYFLIGDNSRHSYDSRFFGCIPKTKIVGRISFRY